MRNIYLIIIFIMLLSCSENKQKSFNGVVVDKEYIPKHKERRTRPQPAGKTVILLPYIVTVESKFTIWIADRNTVKSVLVDSLNYSNLNIGDKYITK